MIKQTGTIILIIGVIFLLSFGSLAYYQYFAPKWADAERNVWENTPSRTNAAITDINKRMLEYTRAETQTEKKAICSYLRNSYPTFDSSKIKDTDVRDFFRGCRRGDLL